MINVFGCVSGAVLTVDPKWSAFHDEESFNLICDIDEGKETDSSFIKMDNIFSKVSTDAT